MQPVFIAGPCVIESQGLLDEVAACLTGINKRLGVDVIFKSSFDKANRTSIHSYRGPGMDKGLQMLADIKSKYGLRVLTDIHESWQAEPVGKVVDVIQIPAFLCRQTDLLVAAARTGCVVNIKKAQFLSGRDMLYPVEKAREAGAKEVHVRLSAPPFLYPCYFGTDIDSSENLFAYMYSDEEMRRILDVDSIHFLSVESVVKLTDSGERGVRLFKQIFRALYFFYTYIFL